jgi:hypothetical protein
MWLTAGTIRGGSAQIFIVQQAGQNRILHSVHVLRDKSGDDTMLMIFEDEEHAKKRGVTQAELPEDIIKALREKE